MPLYDFICQDCGNDFEKIVSFSDQSTPVCPACQSAEVKRQMGLPAVHFKGSGWYITDSKKSNKSESKSAKDGDGKSDGESAQNGDANSDTKGSDADSSGDSSTSSESSQGDGAERSGTSSKPTNSKSSSKSVESTKQKSKST